MGRSTFKVSEMIPMQSRKPFIPLLVMVLVFLGPCCVWGIGIDSVYPTLGEIGQDLTIRVNGSGFNESTRTAFLMDTGNTRMILGYTNATGAKDIVVEGNLAYTVNWGISITDVSNPLSPVLLNKFYSGVIMTAIDVVDHIAYTVDSDDLFTVLWIFDVSAPKDPMPLGSFDDLDQPTDVKVKDGVAYIRVNNGLKIVDVHDPKAPAQITFLSTGASHGGIEIVDALLYAANATNGFLIIDIENPALPQIIGSLPFTDHDVQNVSIDDGYAYIMSHDTARAYLSVVDITDPTQPEIVGTLASENFGNTFDIDVSDGAAGIADFIYGLQIIDVSDPTSPQVSGFVDTRGEPCAIEVIDQTAYVANGSSLSVIDIGSPAKTQFGGQIDMDSTYEVEIVGDTAYVAATTSVKIIDISVPFSPVSCGNAEGVNFPWDLHADGSRLYVADTYYGLKILNIENPKTPVLLGQILTPDRSANGVYISGNTAYVADGGGGLQIIDVEDPESPSIVGSYAVSGNAYDVYVKDNVAYVADFSAKEILAIDVGNLSDIRKIGAYTTFSYPKKIGGQDNYIYVAEASYGLRILDISDPASMQLVKYIYAAGTMNNFCVVNDTAYLAADSNGIHIHDISDPYNPISLGTVKTNRSAYDIDVIGNAAYVADGPGGFTSIPIPMVIAPQYISENELSLTMESPAVAGNYNLKAFNYGVQDNLNGAVTIVPDEKSYLLDTKAIIVAGGGGDVTNKIREETVASADNAFEALLYQGYTQESIYYLSWDTANPNVDDPATKNNVITALTTWVNSDPFPSEVLIYLVDHGADGLFRIDATEVITAEEFDGLLDDLQNQPDGPSVLVVYDACESGTFLPKVTHVPGMERLLITSASQEPAYFLDQGKMSFSFLFWKQIGAGSTIDKAFEIAKNQMTLYQTSLLDYNGNGVGNETPDISGVSGRTLRRGYRPKIDAPYIYDYLPPQVIHSETSLEIWAGVAQALEGTPVRRVWAVITPPDFEPGSPDTPISELPALELTDDDGGGKYTGTYTNFSQNGIYAITICAENESGAFALFRNTVVNKVPPYIQETIGTQMLTGSNTSVNLWANVSTGNPDIAIQRVWCEILSPTSSEVSDIIELTNTDGNAVYEGVYDRFDAQGAYLVYFYAEDENGVGSLPGQTQIILQGVNPDTDTYEPDNDYPDANYIRLEEELQTHNFHDASDSDWIKFLAVIGRTYAIRAKNLFLSCDLRIDVCTVENATPVSIGSTSSMNPGATTVLNWTCPKTGVYYVHISNNNPSLYGSSMSYDVEIYLPTAAATGKVTGYITDINGKSIKDAQVRAGDATDLSRIDGEYVIHPAPGSQWLTVEAAGRKSYEKWITVVENESMVLNIVLEPAAVSKGDVTADGRVDLKDALAILKIMTGTPGVWDNTIAAADIDGDGKIGLEDLLYVLRDML